jgi:hypothetical protein
MLLQNYLSRVVRVKQELRPQVSSILWIWLKIAGGLWAGRDQKWTAGRTRIQALFGLMGPGLRKLREILQIDHTVGVQVAARAPARGPFVESSWRHDRPSTGDGATDLPQGHRVAARPGPGSAASSPAHRPGTGVESRHDLRSSNPDASFAYVRLANEAGQWVRQGAQVGHIVIKEIRHGSIMYWDGRQNVETVVERVPQTEGRLETEAGAMTPYPSHS